MTTLRSYSQDGISGTFHTESSRFNIKEHPLYILRSRGKIALLSRHFHCPCCQGSLQGIPALVMALPDALATMPVNKGHVRVRIDTEICRILYPKTRVSFVRANLMIPIKASTEVLDYGVWVRLTEMDFQHYLAVQNSLIPTHVDGWLANAIPGYSQTLHHPVSLHNRGATLRPMIQPDADSDSDFARECLYGLTLHEATARMDAWILSAGEEKAA